MRVHKDKAALNDAWRALVFLDTPIKLSDYGDIVGVEEVDLGMDALVSALTRLFTFPDAGEDVAPEWDEVLSYLASTRQVPDELIDVARKLARLIHQAGYEPLSDEERLEAESARSRVYEEIEALLSRVERELA